MPVPVPVPVPLPVRERMDWGLHTTHTNFRERAGRAERKRAIRAGDGRRAHARWAACLRPGLFRAPTSASSSFFGHMLYISRAMHSLCCLLLCCSPEAPRGGESAVPGNQSNDTLPMIATAHASAVACAL